VTIAADEVRCSGCRRRYPLESGVPIMLVDQAQMPIDAGSERVLRSAATDTDAEE